LPRKKGAKLTAAQKRKCVNVGRDAIGAKLDAYIANYAGGLSSLAAAKAAGITLQTVSYYKKRDMKFAERWQEAYDEFTTFLEATAESRAQDLGDRFSGTMLIFMLKARKPSVYRDNVAIMHSGNVEFSGAFAAAMNRVSGVSSETLTDAVH
jgi:hypothetical protein